MRSQHRRIYLSRTCGRKLETGNAIGGRFASKGNENALRVFVVF